MSRRTTVAIALAAGFLVRVVAIDADPPPWHQLGFISDEGWWAHNARNRALFGSFVTPGDEFNQGLWISPVFTLLGWASFAVFGTSLASLRAVSALASVVTAAALARTAGRLAGPEAAPLAAILYLFSPFAWAFGRVGLVEETMNAFVALAFALWAGGSSLAALAAGLAHAAAFGTKSYALVAGIGIAADGLLGRESWSARLRRLGAYGCGLLLGLAVWHVAIQRPHGADIAELNLKLSQDNLPGSALAAIRNCLELPFERGTGEPGVAPWLLFAPVPAALMALALAGAASLPPARLLQERALRVGIPVLGAYLALLGPMAHKPDRRYAVLLIPEVLLACWAATRLRDIPWPAPGPAGRLLAPIPVILLLATPVAVGIGGSRTGVIVAFLGAGAALWLVAVAAGPPLLQGVLRALSFPSAATLVLFAAVVGREALRTTFTVRDEGRAVAAIVKDDRVIGGVADTLLLESRATTYNDMRKGTAGRFNGDLLVGGRIPWLLTWTQPERLLLPEDPRVMAGAEKIRETPVLPVGDGGHRATILLWRLPAP